MVKTTEETIKVEYKFIIRLKEPIIWTNKSGEEVEQDTYFATKMEKSDLVENGYKITIENQNGVRIEHIAKENILSISEKV